MEQFLKQLELSAQTTLRKTLEFIDIGAFCAYFDSLSDLIWFNYATPMRAIGSQRELRFALDDLRAEFARRRRRLRFEFIQPLWPRLGAMLLDEGFVLQAEQPLMICARDSFQKRWSSGLRICRLSARDDEAILDAYQRTVAEGFAGAGGSEISQASRQRLRVELKSDSRRAVIGFIDEAPAGVAALSPMGEMAELVGVTTLARYRRRGVASALSCALLAEHFSRGHSAAWLSAGDAVARSVYEGIGFSDAGVYANYISPTGLETP